MVSAREKGGRWYYRFSYEDETGKRRFVERGGFNTEKQALHVGGKMEDKMTQQKGLLKGEMYVGKYFEEYYYKKVHDKIKPRTQNNYLHSIKYADKYFGRKRLVNVTNTDYQEFIDDYAKSRAKETVQKIHSHLKKCFKYALSQGHIVIDPTFDIHIWGKNAPKKAKDKYISKNESVKLIKALLDQITVYMPSRYMLLIIFSGGLRFSEALGLTYKDFDFENNTINIDKTFDYKITHKKADTKNEQSERVLQIDPKTMDLLHDYINFHQVNDKVQGINPDGYAFCDSGKPISHNAVVKTLTKACKRAGIKRITPHGLRHTHASLMLYNKNDIQYIASRLGHESTVTTRDVYSHVIDEMKDSNNKSLMDMFDDMF